MKSILGDFKQRLAERERQIDHLKELEFYRRQLACKDQEIAGILHPESVPKPVCARKPKPRARSKERTKDDDAAVPLPALPPPPPPPAHGVPVAACARAAGGSSESDDGPLVSFGQRRTPKPRPKAKPRAAGAAETYR